MRTNYLKLFIVAIFLGSYCQSSAQIIPEYENFNWEKLNVPEAKVIPKPHLIEANVKYSKRIHRVIDTRQKKNRMLAWDRSPFAKYLFEGALRGDFTAYQSDSLFMSGSYNLEKLKGRLTYEEWLPVDDTPYGEFGSKLIPIREPIDYRNTHKIRVMEEWIFDSKHSTFKPRIIAIAPLYQPIIEGILLSEQPLFWVYMEELRPIIAKQELFNTHNDAARLSVNDFFEMRLFDSYIVKESNMYGLDFNHYQEYENDNLAMLIKGESVKNDLFIFEHELWEY